MKSILTLTTVILLSSSAFGSQVVTKDLGKFGSWKVAEVKNHNLWNKEACVASVGATGLLDSKSVLEMYAEQDGSVAGVYVEPTVQILPSKPGTFIAGTLTDDNGTPSFALTLASSSTTPPVLGLVSRVQDRAAILDMIRKSSTVKVQLIGPKNKLVKTLSFSLSGSSKALSAAYKGCALDVTPDL